MSADTDFSARVTVGNALGLHARPAAQLVRLANGFKADITLNKSDTADSQADCRSVLSLLMLAAAKGTQLEVRAAGEDALAAGKAVVDFFTGKCGEE